MNSELVQSEISSSEYIAKFLVENGIEHVFGIVGAGCAQIFDAISKKPEITLIAVHHEQAATMAMQAYYKTSGKIAACVLTTGGGAANGFTGVVSSFMDSTPGLIISGNERSAFTKSTNQLRVWGVQGFDIISTVKAVTKYAERVNKPHLLPEILHNALFTATHGRKGPVWIDIPLDIQGAKIDATKKSASLTKKNVIESPVEYPEVMNDVMALLDNSRRPVLLLGAGVYHSGFAEVEKFVEEIKIPVLLTWSAITLLSSRHPMFFGCPGVYGQRCANFVMENSDLLISIGSRLSLLQVGYDYEKFLANKKLVYVDIDQEEIKKIPGPNSLTVRSDSKIFIESLRAKFAESRSEAKNQNWIDLCNDWRARYPRIGPEHDDTNGFINSYRFMDRLSDFIRKDEVIVTDMGTELLSGFTALRLSSEQKLVTSLGLGEMGFGLPGAIGACFANQTQRILCLNCDGGMMMNLQELQTIAHHQLPIRILIFNNDGYLMIKHTQKSWFDGNYVASTRDSGVSCPDFSKLAMAFGFQSVSISNWDDVDKHMPAFIEAEKPSICEVFMDPHQNFYPKLETIRGKNGGLTNPAYDNMTPAIDEEQFLFEKDLAKRIS